VTLDLDAAHSHADSGYNDRPHECREVAVPEVERVATPDCAPLAAMPITSRAPRLAEMNASPVIQAGSERPEPEVVHRGPPRPPTQRLPQTTGWAAAPRPAASRRMLALSVFSHVKS
jgi:hypothetical protein